MLNMVRKLLTEYHPQQVAIVFDPPGKTARETVYPDYKKHRPSMPDSLRTQIPPLFEVIQAMGLPLLQIEGIEADDVIATLTTQAVQQAWKVVISTSDKDMAQLVNEQVALINTMSNTLLDRSGVIKKFGVTPEQIVDYLALMGDSSDNIPGVPLVGPKTASKWLNTYGSLSEIIQHADQITGKIGENLRQSMPQFPMIQTLLTLEKNIPLPYHVSDLTPKTPDEPKLIALYTQLEFKTWLPTQTRTPTPLSAYPTMKRKTDCEKWFQLAQTSDILILYLEAKDETLFAISCATLSQDPISIPLHPLSEETTDMTPKDVLHLLEPWLHHSQKTLVGYGIQTLITFLLLYDMPMPKNACLWDVQLAAHVLNSTLRQYSLESLAAYFLKKEILPLEKWEKEGKEKKHSLSQLSLNQMARYMGIRVDTIRTLYPILQEKISSTPKFSYLFQEVEIPLACVLARMYHHGVCLDSDLLKTYSQILSEKLSHLTEEAYTLANGSFNLSSPKQLADILYQKMQLPVLEKTPSGAPSTSEAVLHLLAADYALPKIILAHRMLNKLKTTYTDTLPTQISPRTGRLHTTYHQTGTTTGRLSSSNPNLQNIPIRHAEGKYIRHAFIAPPGYCILSADYSQIELRIMAHFSQDPHLVASFEKGEDIHTATAATIFHTPLSEVTAEQRRCAKAINFGLIYGMSAFGLAKQLNVPRNIAQTYIDHYFAKYTSVQRFMETTRQHARENGYVETLLGRRLYIPQIKSHQTQQRQAAERTAINAPMQGTAAELIKLAMLEIDAWIQQASSKNSQPIGHMVMQVHDELVFEVLESHIKPFSTMVRDKMTSILSLSVPLEIHVRIGKNWGEVE